VALNIRLLLVVSDASDAQALQ
jgi:hypothetical protein